MKAKIIYEDNHILVVYKPAGIAVQAAGAMEMDLVSELKNYLNSPYVGLIHRLDQPVEGILVFAKSAPMASALSRQVADGTMKKEYLAAVLSEGEMQEKATLMDYLLKDGKTNISKVTEASVKNAKKAVLSYEVQKMVLSKEIMAKYGSQNSTNTKTLQGWETERITLLKIQLKTGRHHQIRVQLSNADLPLLGDLKYGSEKSKQLSAMLGVRDVALCAQSLCFIHPKTGKTMEFRVSPEKEILQNLTV